MMGFLKLVSREASFFNPTSESIMIINSLNLEITKIPDWASQLANLTKTAWTGKGGRCYFPYLPLTTEGFWRKEIITQWQNKRMVSWVTVDNNKIIAHAALVQKNSTFEFGRFVSYTNNPKGVMFELCRHAIGSYIVPRNISFVVETTQAHTRTQYICEKLGLRFAGIGFLDKIDGVSWDIIYYDNLPIPPFEPRSNILGNPLGQDIFFDERHRPRMAQIPQILTVARDEELPPQKFHILKNRLDTIIRIIELNNV